MKYLLFQVHAIYIAVCIYFVSYFFELTPKKSIYKGLFLYLLIMVILKLLKKIALIFGREHSNLDKFLFTYLCFIVKFCKNYFTIWWKKLNQHNKIFLFILILLIFGISDSQATSILESSEIKEHSSDSIDTKISIKNHIEYNNKQNVIYLMQRYSPYPSHATIFSSMKQDNMQARSRLSENNSLNINIVQLVENVNEEHNGASLYTYIIFNNRIINADCADEKNCKNFKVILEEIYRKAITPKEYKEFSDISSTFDANIFIIPVNNKYKGPTIDNFKFSLAQKFVTILKQALLTAELKGSLKNNSTNLISSLDDDGPFLITSFSRIFETDCASVSFINFSNLNPDVVSEIIKRYIKNYKNGKKYNIGDLITFNKYLKSQFYDFCDCFQLLFHQQP